MLTGQVALVTGASRGIGQAIGLTLAAAGATVLGTATSSAGVTSWEQALAKTGGQGSGMILNVKDGESILKLVEEIKRGWKAVTVLVNNAGVTRDMLALRLRDEDWDEVLDTNLKAVFRLSRAVLRDMLKARKGRIINIGSVVGSMGNQGQANYAAAKAGLEGLTKSLAREVGARGVTVNCVAPGFIATDMTEVLSAEQRQALLGHIPLGRLGTPAEVAQAVLFLASPGANYITGTTLHVNGGMLMP